MSLPAISMALCIIGALYTLAINFVIEGPPMGFFYHHRVFFWRLLVIAVLLTTGLILAFMIHVCVTSRLHAEAKGIWLLSLVIGNVLMLPLYGYFIIWRQSAVSVLTAPQPVGRTAGGEQV